MTPYERNLMMRIQFSQLEINDPMQDDYYYHVRAGPDAAHAQRRARASHAACRMSKMMAPLRRCTTSGGPTPRTTWRRSSSS